MKNVIIFSILLLVTILSQNKQSSVSEYSDPVKIIAQSKKSTKSKINKKSLEITETPVKMTEEYKRLLSENTKELSSTIYKDSMAKSGSQNYHSSK